MFLFQDLSPGERTRHLEIAVSLIEGNCYRFKPAIHAVPLERLIAGVLNQQVPIKFSYGQFLRFRGGPSKFQDCLFMVQTRTKHEDRSGFIVPLLFAREIPRPRLV